MIENFKKEFICGRKFQEVSNFIIDTGVTPNYSDLKNKDIIWCKTDFVLNMFLQTKHNKESFILITHNSDKPITEHVFKYRSNCIKKWFAINVDLQHSDLIPIPIGVENDKGPSKGPYADFSFIEKYQTIENKITNKIYCNFQSRNRVRRRVFKKLKKEGFVDQWKKYEDYCANMSKYKYIASPNGNGLDCHRTWEALYLGSYPVVQKHFMYDAFSGLPIVQTDMWNINLEDVWQESKKVELCGIVYEKLKMSYWESLILKERNLI